MSDKEFGTFLKENAPQCPPARKDVLTDLLQEIKEDQVSSVSPLKRRVVLVALLAVSAASALFIMRSQRLNEEALNFSDAEVIELYEGLYGSVINKEDNEYESSLLNADI